MARADLDPNLDGNQQPLSAKPHPNSSLTLTQLALNTRIHFLCAAFWKQHQILDLYFFESRRSRPLEGSTQIHTAQSVLRTALSPTMNVLLHHHNLFPHQRSSPRRSPSSSRKLFPLAVDQSIEMSEQRVRQTADVFEFVATHRSMPLTQNNKRKADDDFDDANNNSQVTGRHIRPVKKSRSNNVAGRPLDLPRLLETLDADSLRTVLQTICDRHPQIGHEVVTSAPRPSIESALGVLGRYQDRFRQAFPFGGNMASDYAYNRVSVYLKQLIEAISDFVPHYLPPNEPQATASLEFLDSVTNIIHEIPVWESQLYRHHKDNAYDEISKAWSLVIGEASKRGGGFQLHNQGWDNKVQQHNARSGGLMQAAVNALGTNLDWIGGGNTTQPLHARQNDPNSIRNQLLNGTFGSDIPSRGGW